MGIDLIIVPLALGVFAPVTLGTIVGVIVPLAGGMVGFGVHNNPNKL